MRAGRSKDLGGTGGHLGLRPSLLEVLPPLLLTYIGSSPPDALKLALDAAVSVMSANWCLLRYSCTSPCHDKK
jgi:hypothetical protein